MTVVEQFAGGTARLAAAAVRLETLERRHRMLVAGFARLERAARSQHQLGRSAASEMARLARLDRKLARGEDEALALVRAVLPFDVIGSDRG